MHRDAAIHLCRDSEDRYIHQFVLLNDNSIPLIRYQLTLRIFEQLRKKKVD